MWKSADLAASGRPTPRRIAGSFLQPPILKTWPLRRGGPIWPKYAQIPIFHSSGTYFYLAGAAKVVVGQHSPVQSTGGILDGSPLVRTMKAVGALPEDMQFSENLNRACLQPHPDRRWRSNGALFDAGQSQSILYDNKLTFLELITGRDSGKCT